MKTNTTTTIITSLLIAILFGATALCYIHLKASNKLLDMLAAVQPGTDISLVKRRCGEPMCELTTAEEIIMHGSTMDAKYLNGKKLFWFYISTPPCRVLEVYTDANDIIDYVTWHGL